MMNLTKVLDGFVLKLKASRELSSVRFVHAGKGEFAPRPLTDFLIACSVAKEELRREGINEQVYEGNMEFTLYAPQGEGKRPLSLISQTLATELAKADEECLLEKITIADSTYDSNLAVWKQVVRALYSKTLHSEIQPEDNNSMEVVHIGTQRYSDVTQFEVVAECSAYERRELLSGAVEEYIAPEKTYTIKILLQEGGLLPDSFANRSVNLYRESANMTYDDCRLAKIENKTKGSQVVTFICRRAHKGAEVTV